MQVGVGCKVAVDEMTQRRVKICLKVSQHFGCYTLGHSAYLLNTFRATLYLQLEAQMKRMEWYGMVFGWD